MKLSHPDSFPVFGEIAARYRVQRWRVRARLERAGRAWRYLTGTCTEDDADAIIYEIRDVSGRWPLGYFTYESCMESARARWGESFADEHLADYVRAGCEHVADKWPGDLSEHASAAEDWALDLAKQDAERAGLALPPEYEGDRAHLSTETDFEEE